MALGLLGFKDAEKPIDITWKNQKISLEHLLNDWLAIDGSLQNSFFYEYYLTKNNTELQSSDYAQFQIAAILLPELHQISDLHNWYGLIPERRHIQNVRTYDYDLIFPIPNQGIIDPFFRISAGRGFLTSDLVGP